MESLLPVVIIGYTVAIVLYANSIYENSNE
jgi:hypothetical protein